MHYELLDHDHSELEGLLAEFYRHLAAGDATHSHQTLDLLWARLAVHIRAEHLHLFRALLHMAEQPSVGTTPRPTLEVVRAAIAQLRHEHDYFMNDIWQVLKQLRPLLAPADGKLPLEMQQSIRGQIEAINQRLLEHNRREESQVYRWADAWLSPAERAELNEKMKAELAHLPPRLHT